MPSVAPPRARGREVLRERNFAIYFWSTAISNAGSFMQGITVPFTLYELTRSNSWVGFGSVGAMIPSLLVSPLSGTIADRFSRRMVLLWANVVQLVAAALLTACALADALSPWLIIGLVAIGSAGAGFQYSSAQSMPAVLLPPDRLLQGVRVNSVGFTASRAIGPAIAGIVLDRWGATTTFTLNTLSFVVVIVGLSFVKVRETHRPTVPRAWHREFVDGIRYVAQRRPLRLIVLTAFVGAFFGQSMAQLAAGLVKESYGVEGAGLGWLTAMYGAGTLSSSVILVVYGDRVARSRMVRSGLLLFAVGICVSVATTTLAVGLLGFLLAGMAHSLTGISLNTSIQVQIDDAFRGRAVTAYLMALLAGMPLGAFAGGVVADRIGLRPTLAGYAAAITAFLVYAQLRRRGLADVNLNVVSAPDREMTVTAAVPEPA
jgi:MFS family permease